MLNLITKLNFEKLVLIFLALSFFIGIWHAFPMLNVVADEMYFVGGVLRAMENKTILPAVGDVPYGTLTYFFNYILVAFYLMILLPFYHFNISGLKDALVQSPEIVYWLVRFLSALAGLVFLSIFHKVLKKEIADSRIRIFILVLLFTNMLTTLVLHTGKQWVISTLLVVVSFYFLYLVFNQEVDDQRRLKKNIFFSVVFAFLAIANLPLSTFALINIPLLIIYFRQRRDLVLRIFKYTIVGFLIYFLFTLLNFAGVRNEIVNIFSAYRPISQNLIEVNDNLSVIQSLLLNVQKSVVFFPLLLITFLLAFKNGIRNKFLFIISSIYFITYFLLISIVATWVTSLYDYSRYLFALAFFLTFIVISLNIRFNKIFYILSGISVVYFVLTLYFLSAPTTFNQAYSWTVSNLNNDSGVIFNDVWELELPKNKQTYSFYQEKYCATKCQNVIEKDLNNYFKPLIIDRHTRDDVTINPEVGAYYFLGGKKVQNDLQLVMSFENNINTQAGFFGVDSRMANYFDLDFFKIKNFGSNIYIYRQLY